MKRVQNLLIALGIALTLQAAPSATWAYEVAEQDRMTAGYQRSQYVTTLVAIDLSASRQLRGGDYGV